MHVENTTIMHNTCTHIPKYGQSLFKAQSMNIIILLIWCRSTPPSNVQSKTGIILSYQHTFNNNSTVMTLP